MIWIKLNIASNSKITREIEFLLYKYSCPRYINILKIRNQQHHCHLNQAYSEGTLQFNFIDSMLASNLGKGGFSEVDLEIINQQFYACKKISLDDYSVNYLLSELNSLRCLDHPNIVKCYGFSVKSFKSFDIYLEYIRGNTIDKAYLNIKSQELLFYWIFQIAQALNYLQSLGIVHRDIKPKNIMVTQKGLVKLVDFGVSKFLSYSQFSVAGSPSYIAPQVLNKKLLCPLSDIWSLGITIYQLIHKHLPFENNYDRKQFNQNKYLSKRGKDISESEFSCSVEMKNLLTAMLNKDPEKRIRPNGVLSHPAIKSREKHFQELYMKNIEHQ